MMTLPSLQALPLLEQTLRQEFAERNLTPRRGELIVANFRAESC